MCKIWAKQTKTGIRIENCIDNWKNDTIRHTDGGIMTS